MIDINLPNFVTVGVIALVAIVVWRFAARATGLPAIV